MEKRPMEKEDTTYRWLPIVIFALAIVLLVTTMVLTAGSSETVETLKRRGHLNEREQCKKAGYQQAHWVGPRISVFGQQKAIFHCADNRGVLFPVAPPTCNSRNWGACRQR